MSVVQIQTRAERLWFEWVALNKKAQASMSFEDGRAAGRAWREFLEEWLPPVELLQMVEERDRRRAGSK